MAAKEMQPRFGDWLLAIRPKTLPAAVGPVAVGSALAVAHGSFSLPVTMACLLVALLLQIGVNLANDYFDYRNRIDSSGRLGPIRVTQAGLIAPRQVLLAMLICLGAALALFAYLTLVGGWVLVVIGGASVIAALLYSGGPYPLASHGLGELFVFIFFGLVAVCTTFYVQSGVITGAALLGAAGPGLLISAIMVVNNLRDIPTDGPAGKRTLAVILGAERTIGLYRLLFIAAYATLPAMAGLSGLGGWVLLPLLSLPWGLRLMKNVGELSGGGYNRLLAATAGFSLIFCLLLALGLLLAAGALGG